jgi:pimeloyl-ACP methyl ester carboxylesterase
MRRAALILAALAAGVPLLLVLTGLVYDPAPGPLRLPRQRAPIEGTTLTYHQRGAGPDVLLLHGGMGSAEDFEPVLDALAAHHRVTAVDRPGFGGSGCGPRDHTYAGNARLIAGLVRALGLRQPVWVGHSHGGGVALRAAVDSPDTVGGLVLIASVGYPKKVPPSLLDRMGALPVFGEGLAAWAGPWLGPGMIESTLIEALGPDRQKAPADFIAWRQRLWLHPRALATHSRQMVTDADGLADLAPHYPRLRVPATVIGCDADPYDRPGGGLDSRRIAREIPNARELWLSGCGHYVQYGRPDEVVAAVTDRSRALTAPAPGT